MEQVKTLREYGLFDAKVPRYTSFPPANRFAPDVGRRHHAVWLQKLDPAKPVSVYIHIPFCRRLCWFCACRTQGTTTRKPIDAYLSYLMDEIKSVAAMAPAGLKMGRLHLGGGTPTLLSARQMNRLLTCVHAAFKPAENFEFSVEIDPTEAAPAVLQELAQWGMQRASIGVQDFDTRVQNAIGRQQSYDQTKDVIDQLRASGVQSLNIDLLYGLPHQTTQTLQTTLAQIAGLRPDRIALYGYAHVPHMSKRQVMIPSDALPSAENRFIDARFAGDTLRHMGYVPLGIDHFALPHDSLAKAHAQGTMRRNFQGYTDDPCQTLLGFGASAISMFAEGYTQNAVATAAYQERVSATGSTAHKGYVLTENDRLTASLIDQIMCTGRVAIAKTADRFPRQAEMVEAILSELARHYPKATTQAADLFSIKNGYEALTRLIAAQLDQGLQRDHIHSAAV